MATAKDFIIIAGPVSYPPLAAAVDRLLAHMAAEFPDYRFQLVQPNDADNELADETVMVLPLVGSVGEGGSKLGDPPSEGIMAAISDRLASFRPLPGDAN